MKNALRLTALVGALVVICLFSDTKPVYAVQDCATKDGAACTTPGPKTYCTVYDDGSQCTYWYPCWCESDYLGGYRFRCGSWAERENCPV